MPKPTYAESLAARLDADPIIRRALLPVLESMRLADVSTIVPALLVLYAWEAGEADPLTDVDPPEWWRRLRHGRRGERWEAWLEADPRTKRR